MTIPRLDRQASAFGREAAAGQRPGRRVFALAACRRSAAPAAARLRSAAPAAARLLIAAPAAARLLIAASAAACLLIASPAAAQEAAAGGPEIHSVRFTGANALDTELLTQAIASRPTSCRSLLVAVFCLIGDFDWAEIKRFLTGTTQVADDASRLETLYEVWGYPDATATGTVIPRGDGAVGIEFALDEGRPIVIRSLGVTGLDGFVPPVQLPAELPLRTGEPYALPRLEAMMELLQELAARRGHPYAQVEVTGAVDEAASAADLTLELQPGPAAVFGGIAIEVEAPITEGAVRSRLRFRPGDTFDPRALLATTRSLYGLPIVERAVIEPVATMPGEPTIETRILVEARRTSALEVEGTLSSTDCLALATFWRHRYFLGGPRVFALGASVSNLFAEQTGGSFPCGSTGGGEFEELDHSLDAELWQPSAFGDARYTLRIGAFTRRQSSPSAWIERGVGARLGLSRDFGRGLLALLEYQLERNELEASATYFCGNYGVCSEAGARALSEPTRLAPLEAVLVWTSTDLPGDVRRADTSPGTPWAPVPVPDWRWTARLAVEGAGPATASQYTFTRALIEGGGTRVLGRSAELAARVRVGTIGGDDVLPPQVRLYSGGVGTVRGAEQNLLGPRVLVAKGDDSPPACAAAADCDLAPIDPRLVSLRPTGGDRLFEANLETRYWVSSMLQLAAFVDYGRLSGAATPFAGGAPGGLRHSMLAPGVGFRLITDLGPIRVDVGYDPSGARTLPLLVDDGAGGVRQAGFVQFDPFEWDDPGFFRALTRRLQVHMAIGQAF